MSAPLAELEGSGQPPGLRCREVVAAAEARGGFHLLPAGSECLRVGRGGVWRRRCALAPRPACGFKRALCVSQGSILAQGIEKFALFLRMEITFPGVAYLI